jgi:hypothetical protein
MFSNSSPAGASTARIDDGDSARGDGPLLSTVASLGLRPTEAESSVGAGNPSLG